MDPIGNFAKETVLVVIERAHVTDGEPAGVRGEEHRQ